MASGYVKDTPIGILEMLNLRLSSRNVLSY